MRHYDYDLYVKIDNLPQIPEELIPSLEDIMERENVCPTGNIKPEKGSVFKVFDADPELYEFLAPYLDGKPVNIRWQLVTADLPVHYDWGTSWDKYLYLIYTGGPNVVTKFWSEKEDDPITGGSVTEDDREVVLEVSETEKSWFRLNVKAPHQVVGIESPRLALIIRP